MNADLADLARRARYPTPDAFEMDGAVRPRLGVPTLARPEPRYPPVVAEAAQRLYDDAYVRNTPEGRSIALHDRALSDAFAERLASFNAGTGAWTTGWTKVSESESGVLVTNAAGQRRAIARADWDDEARRVRLDKGTATAQAGWYHARGDLDHGPGGPPTVRLYWNVCAAGAAPLVRAVTTRLNAARIPFHFKVLSDPQRFMRADAAVLYAPLDEWPRLARVVPAVHKDVAPWLRAATPLFAQRLARGLAAAEDPGGLASFGVHRCTLVAEGLWDAREGGDREASVEARFRAAGVDPDAPWRRLGSASDFTLPLQEPKLPYAEAAR